MVSSLFPDTNADNTTSGHSKQGRVFGQLWEGMQPSSDNAKYTEEAFISTCGVIIYSELYCRAILLSTIAPW